MVLTKLRHISLFNNERNTPIAANISHNLHTLGVPSSLCGVIGNDFNGRHLEALLEEIDVSKTHLIKDPTRNTTFKERVTTRVQQICRVDYETQTTISPEIEEKFLEMVRRHEPNHSALIIEDYSKGVCSERLLPELISIYRKAGKIVAVDPGRKSNPLLYKGATLLKPNLSEAKLMVEALGHRERGVQSIAEILLEKLELEKIVITLGPDGMALIDTMGDGDLKLIPTAATEVFDVSGAGDTAISALTSALLAGASLSEAAWIGNCAAGVVVGKTGTATVSLHELGQFFEKLAERMERTN